MGRESPALKSRIVLFGATGVTGRRIAERLVAAGERPLLAGRSEKLLQELSQRLGDLPFAHADALRQNSVFSLVEEDDVLVSTVGPFARWGSTAVRAAIAAGATYMDSTGEPVFIRRIYDEFGPAASRAGAPLLTALGFDYVPGALAGGLALREAGEDAVRVDVGYFAFGAGPASLSLGTRLSLVGAALDDQHAFRDGRLRLVRAAERAREFRAKGRSRTAMSLGGAEHFTLPAAFPALREVNVYLGVPGSLAPLVRPAQAWMAASSLATRLPGARTVMSGIGERVAAAVGSDDPRTEGVSWIVGAAYSASGEQLGEVHLQGEDPYSFTAGFIAWAARRAAGRGIDGAGALGPVEAFGLDDLETGCAEAGLTRVVDP